LTFIRGFGLVFLRHWKNVTGRGAIDEQTRRADGILEAMLDTLDTGVVACAADGSLTLFNRAARELHGQDSAGELPEEWAERFDLYAPDGCTLLSPEEVLCRALCGVNSCATRRWWSPLTDGRPAGGAPTRSRSWTATAR